MPTYEARAFQREIEIDDDEEIVAAELSASGMRATSNGVNVALVKCSPSDSEGVEYECGYDAGNGPCGRSVGGPDERCWQHE